MGRSGPQNPNWKGGRVVEPRGYVLIRVGVGHPLADVRGYAYEHRLKAAKTTDVRGLHVHHEDENTSNNDDHNLEPMTPAEHRRRHRKSGSELRNPGEPNTVHRCACGCGQPLTRFDEQGRPRRFLRGHNKQPSPTIDAILRELRRHTRLDASAIIANTGGRTRVIRVTLSKLVRAGKIRRVARATYELGDRNG